ncbi:cell wall hydrolase [Microvirga pudoricolor]|uniref:cell wall hydrolase n=1 Tax=Microvirga pudoricolor TaxID=2778729 RepID=UPI0019519AE5|nr:cell wall hydrolase [Microvirga pudoricolor]MBM6594610.1 cell wall hydrolase [Microvirga pudoricolor]
MKWICATVVPWVLAGGMLLSFTASASNDAGSGVSAATRSAVAYLTESVSIVPPISSPAGHMVGVDLGSTVLRNIPRYDLPEDAFATAIGSPPRSDRKSHPVPNLPTVDRTLKGNPVVAVRPTISRMANTLRGELVPGSARLMFNRDERLLPPTVLMQGKLEAPPLQQEGFEPWQAPELTTTRQATSIQSPAAAAAGSTGAAASSTTPSTSRAIVLSSTTPAPVEMTPMEIAAAPVSRIEGGLTFAPKTESQPNYVDLIDPDNMGKEQRCLAEAVYFEARSESESGQAAVAQVVLNRVRSGLYPASICGVVYQNRHRHLACQFTFACEGKALRTTDTESWERAKRIASAVLEGKTYLADVGGATHYHADYVRPYWARRLKKMDVIGRHIFYKLKPGQT